MQVHLDPDQYRKLVELAYLGEWVINAHHDTDYQDDQATSAVQALLKAGPVEGIGRDDETGEYFLEADWVERLYDDYILDYDDHVFWDELTERLAARDLARERGVSPDDILRDDDLMELRPLEERYRQELEENGVERLDIHTEF
ncbi:MAG: hypothetical protein K0S68_241 [Candidatus Saccharibacteria bacterium]|nr:hypothetical protein [Candidatus Saccharibacteria bacterium]